MIAIIETGGKQYTIYPGQKITVQRLKGAIGSSIELSNLLDQTKVKAEIVDQVMGPKVMTRKFRNKTRYYKLQGFRSPMTVLQWKEMTSTHSPKKKEKKSEEMVVLSEEPTEETV